MVEVVAARRPLVFAKELDFDRVIVEGDSASTITSINGGHMDHSALGHVLLDIKYLFSSFSYISIQHINREGNVWHISLRGGLQGFLFWFRWSLFHQTFLMCTNSIC